MAKEIRKMLVLSRRTNEDVFITVPVPGGEPVSIRVTVVSIDPTRIKLGFDAPRHVAILRGDAKKLQERGSNDPPYVS